MKIRHIVSAGIVLVGGLAGSGAADAGQVLYSDSAWITGQTSGSDTFNLSGPGTLTVSLTNDTWPAQLASLNAVVSTPSGLLGPEMGAGTQTFDAQGGNVTVQWFGTAQGSLNEGMYSLNVQFQPSGVNAVPLPASVALLASGLLLLGWQRRYRTEFRLPSMTAT